MSKAIDFTTNIISGNLNALTVKEYALDAIAWGIGQSLLHQLSQNIIQWIKNGDSRGPSFIENFSEHFMKEMDNAVGLWMQQYFGTNSQLLGLLCQPFRLTLPPLLKAYGSRQPNYTERARCKLSDIVKNVENFDINVYQNDFSQGGWDAWFAMLSSDSNFIGSYLSGISEIEQTKANALFASQTEVNTTGGGLLSWQECEDVAHTDEEGVLTGETFKGKCKIQTPGGLVQDSLKQAFGNDVERLRMADEINEVLSTLVGTMINSLISSDGSGFSNTDFNAVVNTTQDTLAPTVIITSPIANQKIVVGNIIPLNATAYDDVKVAGVQFYIDNVKFGGEILSAPYQAVLNPISYTIGTHSISAVARDTSGKTASSSINILIASTTSSTITAQ